MPKRLTTLLCLATLVIASGQSLAEESVSDSMKKQASPILYALSLLGTPYKFGGNNPDKGVDCSGLVRHVYKRTENLDLPRSANAISQDGMPVAREDLKPGDLVFFNTLKRPFSHVGIYAGEGKFIHASSRREKEVTVSSIEDSYWAHRFNGARRLIQPE